MNFPYRSFLPAAALGAAFLPNPASSPGAAPEMVEATAAITVGAASRAFINLEVE